MIAAAGGHGANSSGSQRLQLSLSGHGVFTPSPHKTI